MWIVTMPDSTIGYWCNKREDNIISTVKAEFGDCTFHFIPDRKWGELTKEVLTYDEEGKANPADCRKWTFNSTTGVLTVTDMSDKPKTVATYTAEKVTE